MHKRKECVLKLLSGLGWTGFGGVSLITAALPFWIGWAALVAGLGMAASALDQAFEPEKW